MHALSGSLPVYMSEAPVSDVRAWCPHSACLSDWALLPLHLCLSIPYAALGLTAIAMLSLTVWGDELSDMLLDAPLFNPGSEGELGLGARRVWSGEGRGTWPMYHCWPRCTRSLEGGGG